MKGYIALDLGASNGRCVLGQFDGERPSLKALQRFENGPIELMGHLYWDVLGLYSNIRQSLQALGSAGRNKDIASLGVDAWGCDFALLDAQGKLVGNPYCYRDPQTQGMLAEVLRRVPREEIFQRTGLQFMELNSLYQLMAMQMCGDPLYQSAATFLHVPDLMHYWLTGVKASGQPIPQSKGEIVRLVLESLAYKYRYTLERVQAVSGQKAQVLHIIGGGSRNRLLNQFSANATGLEVRAGPAEATAIGNVLVQMAALGHLASLEEGRALVRRSFPCEAYAPQEVEAWEENYERFLRVNAIDKCQ